MCFVSCGGSKSDSQEASETVSDNKGVLADLIDVYIEMSELKHEMEERYSKNDLSDEEKQQIREQIKTYKKYETLINEGTYCDTPHIPR